MEKQYIVWILNKDPNIGYSQIWNRYDFDTEQEAIAFREKALRGQGRYVQEVILTKLLLST